MLALVKIAPLTVVVDFCLVVQGSKLKIGAVIHDSSLPWPLNKVHRSNYVVA